MNRASIKVLVLDDDPFMLKLMAHMLAGLGFQAVTTCDNGVDALAGFASAESVPDVILLDLVMPGMDGIQFVRKLVELGYTGSLVLLSGESERLLQMSEKLIQAHRIPVLGHLTKPVSLDQMEQVMARWRPSAKPTAATTRAYSADELRAAIDDAQLVNHYQPKVDVITGDVTGVETLVRWRHPTDGLVYPDRFIGVAEEHGLIHALTKVVMLAAISQSKAWLESGLHLRLAVNVSMDDLASVEFADFVAGAAASAGIAPKDIVLEVTESRLMLDQRGPLETLTRLRLKRFRLSIDDFGTGHSSLAQLRDIPFDELKIDRRFVHGAGHDATTLAMYNASLGLGKQLGMEVVAEGVEDEDDWELVRGTGCDLAQGYFIAKAMPAAELPRWIAAWGRGTAPSGPAPAANGLSMDPA